MSTSQIIVRYGLHPSPFGQCLIGTTNRGICKLAFLDVTSETSALIVDRKAQLALRESFPEATLVRDDSATKRNVAKIFGRAEAATRLPLVIDGTNFQLKVWEALLSIPKGSTASYADVARSIGNPKAFRAVGTACGQNPVAFLIPCHRVLTSAGGLGGYRWGTARKEAILAWEGVHS